MKPFLKLVHVIVRSQVNTLVQPLNAEACDYPAGIAAECQLLADFYKQPVVLLGAREDRHEFLPRAPSSHMYLREHV